MAKSNRLFHEYNSESNNQFKSERNFEPMVSAQLLELVNKNDIDGYLKWIATFPKEDQALQIQKSLFSLAQYFKKNPQSLSKQPNLQPLEFFSYVFSDFIQKAQANQKSVNPGMIFWALKSIGELYELVNPSPKVLENLNPQQRYNLSIRCDEIDIMIPLLQENTLPCKKWNQIIQSLVILSRLNCLQGQFRGLSKILTSLTYNVQQEEFNDAVGYILINIGLLLRQKDLSPQVKLESLPTLLKVSERTANVTELLRIVYGLSICTKLIPEGAIPNEFIVGTLKLFNSEKRYLLTINETALFLKNLGKLIDSGCLGISSDKLIPDICRLLEDALKRSPLNNAESCDAIEGLTFALLSVQDLRTEKLLLELITSLKYQDLTPIEAGKVLKSICLLNLPIKDKDHKYLEQVFAQQNNTLSSNWQKDLQSKINRYLNQKGIKGHCSIEAVIGAWHVDLLIEIETPPKKLVFELDGRHHYTQSEDNSSSELSLRNQDQRRDQWMKEHGYQVTRIKNNEGNTLRKIIDKISETQTSDEKPVIKNTSQMKP